MHDLAALRLHQDGSRVQNSDSNLTSRRTKYSSRDARGNWFAKDAGGLGTIQRRRTITRDADTQEEDVNQFSDSGLEANADEKDQDPSAAPHRPHRKRLRFSDEMDFLGSAPSIRAERRRSTPDDPLTSENPRTSVPSSVRQVFSNHTRTATDNG